MRDLSKLKFEVPEMSGSILLIGNGPSAIAHDLGDEVDSFDEVVRFNKYSLKGFEDKLGTKTTYWATFGRKEYPTSSTPPKKVILTHGNSSVRDEENHVLYRIPYGYHQEKRKLVQDITESQGHAPEPILPSSGLLASLWLLEVAKVKGITLIGFDHFSKKEFRNHHYWIPRAHTKPKEHYGPAEAQLLSEYKSQITYLTP